MDLLPEVIKMRENGVRVDLDGAEKLKKIYIKRKRFTIKSKRHDIFRCRCLGCKICCSGF
jgi:hypothetical protein